MIRELKQWNNVSLGSDVALLLGRRRGANLEVRSLAISTALGTTFRTIATATLQQISDRRAKVWHDLAHLEEDEVFQITPSSLPERVVPQRESAAYRASFGPLGGEIPEAAAHASSLGLLLANPGAADPITVSSARDLNFIFYAVTFSSKSADSVSFVKKHGPLRLMQPDKKFLGVVSGDVVDTADGNILSFARDFDLVIDGDQIVALQDVVQALFLDLNLVEAAVPAMITRLGSLVNLGLSTTTLQAVQQAVAARRILARRLLTLINDPATSSLTPQDVTAYLEKEQIPADDIVAGGTLSCTADTAEAFIDYLLGARARHPFTKKVMRADKRSIVT